nr:MAG: DNA pilot protein [Microvirus sp.]
MLDPGTAMQGASVIAQFLGGQSAQSQASKDRKWQQRLAKNQVQFRVADAKAAGVHPLYALGMQPGGYSPPMHYQGDYGAGTLSQMGQDISRSVLARQTARERRSEMEAASRANAVQAERESVLFNQQVERNNLENRYLASQISRLGENQIGPPEPDSSPRSRVIPSEIIASEANNPSAQAGVITDYQYSRSVDGGLRVVPSADISQRFDEIPGAGAGWAFRNNLVPALTGARPPYPNVRPPRGHVWIWDERRTAYFPRRIARFNYGEYSHRQRRRTRPRM